MSEERATSSPISSARRRISHEGRLMWMAFAAGFPGVLVSMVIIWGVDYTAKVQWTLTLLIVGIWLGFTLAIRERVVFPLQTLTNLLAALREGDYSIRARGGEVKDALGELTWEVNTLGKTLREQRLGAIEATALLRKVMEEIDVAVFAFDADHGLRLVNRAAERLMLQSSEKLTGRRAAELGLEECLIGDVKRTVQMAFPGGTGRWEVGRRTFWEGGLPHHLLVISDLSRALREEERQAWQRLIRVLGHELNNSLAPIKSVAGSLEKMLLRRPRPTDWEEDMQRGLGVIASRSGALSRFMGAYSQLAKLPRPTLRPLNVGAWIRRVARLETRVEILLSEGPEVTINADGDQLDQLLINLLRNAVEAANETNGCVRVHWERGPAYVEVLVEDEGPGLPNTHNLFVPFYTTKPDGSGIGLVLSRQIAEAHGGTLTVENRRDGTGCEARLRLPV